MIFRAAPLILVYFAFAIAIGLSAKIAGLSFALTMLMSVVVFGGSTQMVLIPLLAEGSPFVPTVLTLLLMNLRLLIWSLSLAPRVSSWRRFTRVGFGAEITDETFALHATEWREKPALPGPALRLNVVCHLAHCLGTAVGYAASSAIPDFKAVGLDFVLAPLFIALLVFQIKGWRSFVVAAVSGATVLLAHALGFSTVAVVGATLVASFVGLGLGRRTG